MNGTKRIPFPGNLFTKCLSNRDGESTARFLEEIGYNQQNWQSAQPICGPNIFSYSDLWTKQKS